MLKQLAPILATGTAIEMLWIGSYAIGDFRANTSGFIALMLAAFLLGLLGYFRCPIADHRARRLVLAFALLFRLTALPAEPYQSEDVYRYLWDARVASRGIDPYRYAPEAHELIQLRDSAVYEKLNSKPYITAYPPVSQILFRASVALFGESVLALKSIFALLEFLSVLLVARLIARFRLPESGLYLMAWNPFFVLEFAHSGHSESAMMFLMLLAVYLLSHASPVAAWMSYAGAVLVKLHPALWFPLFLRRTHWKSALAGIATGTALLLPYFSPKTLSSYASSLQLYFQLFEFNASIHYALCLAGRRFYDEAWDQRTGPYLAAALLVIALSLWCRHPLRHELDLLHAGFWVMTADLCLATTVHPWYLAWAGMALPFFPYAFMLYWTGASVFSYIAYAYRPVFEPTWVLVVEYVPMYALMGWEIARRRPLLSRPRSYKFSR